MRTKAQARASVAIHAVSEARVHKKIPFWPRGHSLLIAAGGRGGGGGHVVDGREEEDAIKLPEEHQGDEAINGVRVLRSRFDVAWMQQDDN